MLFTILELDSAPTADQLYLAASQSTDRWFADRKISLTGGRSIFRVLAQIDRLFSAWFQIEVVLFDDYRAATGNIEVLSTSEIEQVNHRIKLIHTNWHKHLDFFKTLLAQGQADLNPHQARILKLALEPSKEIICLNPN